jgi:hypothetical protein
MKPIPENETVANKPTRPRVGNPSPLLTMPAKKIIRIPKNKETMPQNKKLNPDWRRSLRAMFFTSVLGPYIRPKRMCTQRFFGFRRAVQNRKEIAPNTTIYTNENDQFFILQSLPVDKIMKANG